MHIEQQKRQEDITQMCFMEIQKDWYRYKACATAFLVATGTFAAAMKTFSGMRLVLTGYG
jgi:hypothetical protein